MRYSFLLCLPLFLSGCKLITTEQLQSVEIDPDLTCQTILAEGVHPPDSLALSLRAEHCERQQAGTLKVVHPTEPIEVPLPGSIARTSAKSNDVWLHIANNLELVIPKNQPRLSSQKNWYLKHPAYMKRVATRARPFLHYIVQQLEAHDVPLDIALLPIVESAFDPFAYSSSRAAGMWQFIPETGERFGMAQNWWYDGRRDVVASTQGAIDYLIYLNDMFDGNWLHALAAYNSGEGRVKRAIRKNQRLGKNIDFWSLDLPRETRAYVPKLLALADILRHGETYNFDWPMIENLPVIEVVEVGTQIDLAMAARMADLTLQELQALNPGFNQWATNPDGPHLLMLPIDKAPLLTAALSQTPESKRLNWKRHKVVNGDSIGAIAQTYRTNIDAIKRINNLDSDTIYVGKDLLVPVSITYLNTYALNNAQNAYGDTSSQYAKTQLNHTVQSGDTLWDIAQAYDVSIAQLSQWNQMSRNDTLSVGTRLIIWTHDRPANNTQSLTYSVRSGDSLSLIASRFKVTIDDILNWNALNKSQFLQPGQRLKLMIDITKS